MTENCNDCKYEKECNHTEKYDYTYDKIMDYQTNKEYNSFKDICDLLNEQEEQIQKLEKENEKLKRYNKSQELEIVRLHKLADAMSGVLKELGVYDVYDEEQINSVKEKLK